MKDTKDIKEELMQEARDNGICLEGYETMRSCSRSEMIDYYIQNPDWCLERNFPDLHTLETHFSDLSHKGIYVNHTFHGEVLDDLQTYIFHNCKGRIRVRLNTEKKLIPMLYFANDCDMVIECDDNISVPLYIFGDNSIAINNSQAFKFYKHKLLTTRGLAN